MRRAIVYLVIFAVMLVAHSYIRRGVEREEHADLIARANRIASGADRIARICVDADSSAVSAEDWNGGSR